MPRVQYGNDLGTLRVNREYVSWPFKTLLPDLSFFSFRKIFLPINRRYIGEDQPDQVPPSLALPRHLPDVSRQSGDQMP